MQASELKKYQQIDETLTKLSRKINLFYHLTPQNKNSEGRKFFEDNTYEPTFTYKKTKYSTTKLVQELKDIKIPKTTIGKILQQRRERLLAENNIVANRKHTAKMIKYSKELYGQPSKELLAYAKQILKTVPNTELKLEVSPEEVKNSIKGTLKQYGIKGWKVVYDNNKITTEISIEKKTIYLNPDRLFTKKDPKRLAVHEIGVHLLRAENGKAQPLAMFKTGFPTYLATEEGLATYAEEIAKVAEPQTMRLYAGRVVAVQAVIDGKTFRQTFNILKKAKFTLRECWNLSLRAHRAGGYLKDHIYLEGYRKIQEYIKNNGDIKLLYIGKIGIEDLPLVQEMQEAGLLEKPKYLPEFLKA